MAAYYAFEDVKMLHSNSKRYHLFEKDPFVGNAAPAGLHWLQLVLVHCLTVYLWTECCSAQL
jgi:RGM family protein